MKTWTQFLEAKAQLAPMSQQPNTAGVRTPITTRRSANLNLTPAQQQQGQQAYQQATQTGPEYGQPASDEEIGAKYAQSMINQQNMARARRV